MRKGVEGGGGGGSGGFCVGVETRCTSFTLLTPAIIDVLNVENSVILMTELYLICPLTSVFAIGCQPCS